MNAQELRELLRARDCKTSTLASALGISVRTVERYISGSTTIKPLHAMAIKYYFQIS